MSKHTMNQESRHTDQHTTYGRNFDVDNVAKAGESSPQLLFRHPITQATNEKSRVSGIKICGGPKHKQITKGPVTKKESTSNLHLTDAVPALHLPLLNWHSS
jgi:hypothetical protein